MKALDFVRTPKGAIAFVTETNDGGLKASITFVGPNNTGEHNAWWGTHELTVIDSLPRLLAASTAHPFGTGHKDASLLYGERP